MTSPKVTEQHHVLAVPDIAATARWWVDVMGFEVWMEPDGWIFLRRARFPSCWANVPMPSRPGTLGTISILPMS